MATTTKEYTGNGSNYVNGASIAQCDFTFPSLKQTDVKVSLNGTTLETTKYSFPSSTSIQFETIGTATAIQKANGAPENGVTILIYRDTDVENAKAVYAAGSSIRAADLNNNQDQILFFEQEVADPTNPKIFISKNNIADSGVSAGSYGSGSAIPTITVDSKGLITAASTNSIDTDLLADTSPQLGGNLDLNSNNITGTGNISTTGTFESNNVRITKSGSPVSLQLVNSGGSGGGFNNAGVNEFWIINSGGEIRFRDATPNTSYATWLTIYADTDGRTEVHGKLKALAGLDVTGGDITGVLGSAVTGTTQSASDNSTKIATTAYTDTAIANLVSSAPSTLDTLNELAAALGDDANFSTTVTNSIATKLPLAGGTLTGDLTISTTAPLIKFDETDQTTDYFIVANNNTLTLARNNLNTPNHIQKWNADGHVDFLTNVDFASGIDVTGAITSTVSAANTDILTLTANMGTNNNRPLTFKSPATDSLTVPFTIETNNALEVKIDANKTLNIDATGQINLHHAGSSTAKLFTSATGVGVNGTLNISQSGSNSTAGLKILDSNNNGAAPFIEVIGKRSDGNDSQCFSGKVHLAIHRTNQKIDNGKVLGTVAFGGNHTDDSISNILYTASISGVASDSFDSETDMPTDLVFYTGSTGRTPGQANVTTGDERMRIKADGTTVASGALEFANTLTTYDPTVGSLGSETSTTTAISLGFGQQIAVNASGYIRNLLKINSDTARNIEIGQSNTNYIGDIFLLPGLGHAVRAKYDGVDKLITTATGVTVDGVLTTGGLAVDTDTLFVNTSLNRVGIGTSSVGATLHLSSTLPELRFTDTDNNNIDHFISCSGSAMTLSADHNQEDNTGDTTLRFKVDGTERGRFDDAGLDVTGSITIPDATITSGIPNNAIKIGDASNGDLMIYHDSNNSVIRDAGTGALIFQSNQIIAYRYGTNEKLFQFDGNGAASLFYGGTSTAKLATTATGVDVTGDIDITGELNLTGGGNKYFDVDTLSGTQSLRIRHRNNDGTQFEDAAKFTADGGADLYFNGGSTPKLSTTATGVNIEGNTTQTGTNGILNLVATQNVSNAGSKIAFFGANRSTTNEEFAAIKGGLINNSGGSGKQRGYLDFVIGDNSHTHRMNDNGSVNFAGNTTSTTGFGAGTTSPSCNFHSFSDNTHIGHQIRIEQDGDGDAVLGWQLTGVRAWSAGIDNSDSNRWKLSSGSSVDSNTQITIEQDGFVGLHHDSGTTPKLQTSATGVDVTGDVVATGDGTFDDLKIGEWTGGASYGALSHKNQTGNEFMIMSNDGHTTLSATTGQSVIIKGGNNVSTNSIEVDPTTGVNITAANNVNINGHVILDSFKNFIAAADSNDNKFDLFGGNGVYAIGMSNGWSYGGLNGWSMNFHFNNNNDWGWAFKDSAHSKAQGAMSLTTQGKMTVAHSMRLGYGESDTTTPGATHALDVSGSANITGTLEAQAFRFGDSHVKKISVDYFGTSYLVDGEYQEILTITPSGNSQNYSIIGKITANGGSAIQTIDVNIALRSNTRPDLNVAGTYTSTILGNVEHITPRLLLQETGTTGSFKLFVEVNNQINGSITANLDVITRGEPQLNDIVVNTTSGNEVTTLPSGYAVTTPTKIYKADDGAVTFDSALTAGGLTFPTVNGNDGQVLTSDGAGTVQWEDATGGGSSSQLTDTNGTVKVEVDTSYVYLKDAVKIQDSSPAFYFQSSDGNTNYGWFKSNSQGIEILQRVAYKDLKIRSKGTSEYTKILIRDGLSGNSGTTDVCIGRSMGGSGKPTDLNAFFPFQGGVELYHIASDGTSTKKFETTANGITVQGSVTTEDINMSNLNASANEVDNTKGSWTIQEGASDLFLINRVNGKKYKFNLTEIS